MAYTSSRPACFLPPSPCYDRLGPSSATLASPLGCAAHPVGPFTSREGRGACNPVPPAHPRACSALLMAAPRHRDLGAHWPLIGEGGTQTAGPLSKGGALSAAAAGTHTALSQWRPVPAATVATQTPVPHGHAVPARDTAATHTTRASRSGSAGPAASRAWKQRDTKNVQGRARALLHKLKGTDGTREEVVAVLDSWAAFQLDFPLLATKSALQELRKQHNWARLLQVCKWMLAKGHGRTFGTYASMLEALARLRRDAEMDDLWALILEESLETTPRALFAQAMRLYLERQQPLKVLELYGSMDELGVRLDEVTLDVTLEALDQLGAHGHAEQLREQYSAVRSEWRYTNGQRRQVNSFGRPREGQKI